MKVNGLRIGPIWIGHLDWWRFCFYMKHRTNLIIGIFKNKPGIKPGRWGVYFWGIEIGSRNPGNRFGLKLKKAGLWPW